MGRWALEGCAPRRGLRRRVTDSSYLASAISRRLSAAAQGWRTAAKQPVASRDLWECMI
jgi:ribonuclease HI